MLKNKKLRKFFMTCITVFALCIMAGCGGGSSDKFSTVDEVLDNYDKVVKDVENYKTSMKMDLKMELEAKNNNQEIKLSLPVNVKADMSLTKDLQHMKMHMLIDATDMAGMFGQSEKDSKMEMDMESYSVKEDDHYVVYAKENNNDWKVNKTDEIKDDLGFLKIEKDLTKDAELEKDAKNYIVVIKFKEMMENEGFKEIMKSVTQMQGNSDEILDALADAKCKYYFDKESGLLTKMALDNVKATIEKQGIKMNITINLNAEISDYNKTKVELPKEIKELK